MTERVEEIRRAVERAKASHYGIEPDDVAFLLTALAQAERERDQARRERDQEGMEWARRYDDTVQPLQERCSAYLRERDAARAEVERLKGLGSELSNEKWKVSELIRRNDVLHEALDKAEATLARVRAIEERAKQMLYVAGCRDDGINEEMRILWRVLGIDEARAALEGR